MHSFKTLKVFNQEVDKWLTKFAASGTSLPKCFNPAFKDEWDIVRLHELPTGTPANLGVVLNILDFLDYTKSIKAYPFLRKGITIKPDTIRASLLTSLVSAQAAELMLLLTKAGVLHLFNTYKKVITVNNNGSLVVTLLLEPRNRTQLVNAIRGIISTLCKLKKVPPQLQPSKLSSTKVVTNSSVTEWLPIVNLSVGTLYGTVSNKDFLLRFILTETPIFATKKQHHTAWKKQQF